MKCGQKRVQEAQVREENRLSLMQEDGCLPEVGAKTPESTVSASAFWPKDSAPH